MKNEVLVWSLGFWVLSILRSLPRKLRFWTFGARKLAWESRILSRNEFETPRLARKSFISPVNLLTCCPVKDLRPPSRHSLLRILRISFCSSPKLASKLLENRVRSSSSLSKFSFRKKSESYCPSITFTSPTSFWTLVINSDLPCGSSKFILRSNSE